MPSAATRKYVVFRLSGQLCAFAAEHVREVVFLPRLLTPPTLPKCLLGMLELGDRLEPVLRLDHLLGLPVQALTLYTPLILSRTGDFFFACPAERVQAVAEVPAGEDFPLADHRSLNGCVEATFYWEGHAVAALSASRVLLQCERDSLRDYQMRESARRLELTRTGYAG